MILLVELTEINIVDTVPVPAGMYRTDTYTGIETPTFRTGLNTSRIGHISAILANLEQYWPVQKKKKFFFFFLVL